MADVQQEPKNREGRPPRREGQGRPQGGPREGGGQMIATGGRIVGGAWKARLRSISTS